MTGSNQVSNVVSSVVTPVALSGVKTPLLNQFEGAAAAYSLRRLKSWDDGSRVVRVRRESDNTERDFSSVEVSDGTMARWVNEQPTLPLDLRELDENTGERDGALIEAAAAYSLRKLKEDFTGDVVEVRRSSDDAVQSFTASEVADGTLEAWVNADVDKLDLQTETGGLVGNVSNETANSFDFSVNNEGSAGYKNLLANSDITPNASYTATFNVELNSGSLTGLTIRSGNPVEEAAFVIGKNSITVTPSGISDFYFKTDATSVADVSITNITLTQTTADGHVRTWYDQSGSDNHAVQTTAASQPKIVDAGSLLADGISFDGDFFLQKITTDSTVSASIFGVQTKGTSSAGEARSIGYQEANTAGTNSLAFAMDNTIRFDGAATAAGSVTIPTSGLFLASTIKVSNTEANNFLNGASNIADSGLTLNNTDVRFTLGFASTTPDYSYDGSIKEAIFYNSDQSDNRTAIEANIGETYGITEIPAANDTVNGYVQTWYDQSGSGNDAEQTTAANQPKIVDGGSLVTRNGDAAIKSTSDNEMTFTLGSLSADGQQSVFSVLENDVTSQDGFGPVFRVLSTSTSTGGVNRRPYWFVNPTGGLAFTVDSFTGYQNTDREYRLYSHIMNDAAGGTSTVHRDGTQVDTRSITLDANANFSEGKVLGVSTNATGALYMSEVIYYDSDQSSNRTAIETNIANQYGITLS